MQMKYEKVIITSDKEERKLIDYRIKEGRIFREDEELLLSVLQRVNVIFPSICVYMIGGFVTQM